ncbi:MAG TPA: hypothetical protein VF257_14900 [Solirubrobacteraceae bacterium]
MRDVGRYGPLTTSSLFRHLETTEKAGISFRLGMAFAALISEHALGILVLEHLSRGNAVLAPGSARRADLRT